MSTQPDRSGSSLPPVVEAVAQDFLREVGEEVPGLVEGLYLVGSVALGDFRPHESDVDFVAVTAVRPDSPGLEALRRAHSRLRERHRRPRFEGVYLTWDDLARDPSSVAPAPGFHGRRLDVGSFGLDPVTWHTLARHGVAVRGPEPDGLCVWTDSDTLRSWTLDNLESYWRPWLRRYSRPLSVEGLVSLGSWAPAWGVLGVSRLHLTLATGKITSKEGAGLYALETFPEGWHRVISECLRVRRGERRRSLYASPMACRRDALAYIGR